MPSSEDRCTLPLRSLLASAGIPFTAVGYERGAIVYAQGDPCVSVMYIERGRVRLAVTTLNGREAIVGLLEAGAFLGEEALAGRPVRRQTAVAMSATELLVVAKARMLRLLRGQQAISDRFIAYILTRNARLEAELTDQLLNSGEQRLAHTLLVLAGCGERHQSRCVLPDVSQEIIAEMVGTTRSRVNVFMGRFKKLGFIEENGGVLRIKPSMLQMVQARPAKHLE